MFNENHVLHTTLVLTIVLGLSFLVFRIQIALGLLMGGLMGCLVFRLLILDGTKLLEVAAEASPSRKEVARYNRRAFLKRCFFYAAVLSVAILSPYLSFFAALVGLLLPRVAIIYLMFRRRNQSGS